MKIKELKVILDKEVANGNEDVEVYFDTEAVCFNTHYVTVTDAELIEENIIDEKKHFALHYTMKNESIKYNIF